VRQSGGYAIGSGLLTARLDRGSPRCVAGAKRSVRPRCLDAERVAAVHRLAKALGARTRTAQPQLEAISAAVNAAEGKTVNDLLHEGAFRRT
jgi:hypothetical protein